MKNFIVGAVIICLAVVLGVLVGNHYTNLGATTGPYHYNREYFHGGLVQGGGVVTVTGGATVTWTASQVCDYSIIKWVPTVAKSTTTVPTAATIINKCLLKNGDYKDVMYWNAGSAASTTVFTMGSGTTLYIPRATGATSTVAGLDVVRIRFLRASSTAVFMFLGDQVPQ